MSFKYILDLICVQRNIYPCDPSENNDLAEIVKEPDSNEANLILKKLLDAEDKGEHQLVLTLTDNRLGDGNFMTQSLLIIVEDINDNVPIFEVCASILDVFWGQPIKPIQVDPTSEFHEY